MARILTGIQSTGTPHLGNVLGAIRPAIHASRQPGNDSFLFIADLHSLTQIKEAAVLRHKDRIDPAAFPPRIAWRPDDERGCAAAE